MLVQVVVGQTLFDEKSLGHCNEGALVQKKHLKQINIVKKGRITSFVLDYVRVEKFGEMYLNK